MNWCMLGVGVGGKGGGVGGVGGDLPAFGVGADEDEQGPVKPRGRLLVSGGIFSLVILTTSLWARK